MTKKQAILIYGAENVRRYWHDQKPVESADRLSAVAKQH
jgi:hypothetical protein